MMSIGISYDFAVVSRHKLVERDVLKGLILMVGVGRLPCTRQDFARHGATAPLGT